MYSFPALWYEYSKVPSPDPRSSVRGAPALCTHELGRNRSSGLGLLVKKTSLTVNWDRVQLEASRCAGWIRIQLMRCLMWPSVNDSRPNGQVRRHPVGERRSGGSVWRRESGASRRQSGAEMVRGPGPEYLGRIGSHVLNIIILLSRARQQSLKHCQALLIRCFP